jgi:hypothetical protein
VPALSERVSREQRTLPPVFASSRTDRRRRLRERESRHAPLRNRITTELAPRGAMQQARQCAVPSGSLWRVWNSCDATRGRSVRILQNINDLPPSVSVVVSVQGPRIKQQLIPAYLSACVPAVYYRPEFDFHIGLWRSLFTFSRVNFSRIYSIVTFLCLTRKN